MIMPDQSLDLDVNLLTLHRSILIHYHKFKHIDLDPELQLKTNNSCDVLK